MPTHPRAEEARELIDAAKFAAAENVLHPALQHAPNHPDLLCEMCLVYCFTGREPSAVRLYDRAIGGAREALLGKILLEHLLCRMQRDEKTGRKYPRLMEMIFKMRRLYNGSQDPVGVRLTACIIAKDEESMLPYCLESLHGIADEVIVLDTGSTDRTADIARDYGARVSSFDWCDDFAKARNAALDLATGDWILWIDADEKMAPESKAALLEAMTRPQFAGYSIPVISYTEDGDTESTYIHCPVRLFRRCDSVRFEGRVHEQIVGMAGPCGKIDAAKIIHEGYRPSVMAAKGKLERTIAMLQEEVRRNPADPFHWFNLANALTAENRFAEAEHAAAKCAACLEPRSAYGVLNYQLWSNALTQQNKLARALEVCHEADTKGYGGILNEFERAQALLKGQQIEQALSAIERCLACEWPTNLAGDYGIYTHKRHLLHGQILALMGCLDQAVEAFDTALTASPGWGPAVYCKAATLEKLGRASEALFLFNQGRQQPSISSVAAKGAARVSLALGLKEQAAEIFEAAWRGEPSDTEAWIGWAQACEALGDKAGLLRAYEAYATAQEPNANLLINWGRALEEAGQAEKALHCYADATKREPENANARFHCGDLLFKQGHFADAAQMYETALRLDPGRAEGWFVLGNCLAHLGLIDAARKSYHEALNLRPDYAEARQNLAALSQAA